MPWEQQKSLPPVPTVHKPQAKKTVSAFDSVTTLKQKQLAIKKAHAPTLNLKALPISKALLHHGLGVFDVTAPSIVFPKWSEMDVFGLMPSGYVYEYEIKISKADYKADFKKTTGFSGFHPEKLKHHQLRDGTCYPNRFFFVLPAHIADIELPDYAGLVVAYADQYGGVKLKWLKQAPTLHKHKHCNDAEKFQLLKKLAGRYTAQLLA